MTESKNNELVQARKSDIKDLLDNPLVQELIGTGIEKISDAWMRMTEELAQRRDKKYEEEAKVYIVALQEETKREIRRLEEIEGISRGIQLIHEKYDKRLEQIQQAVLATDQSETYKLELYKKFSDDYRATVEGELRIYAQIISGIFPKKKGVLERLSDRLSRENT